MHRLRKAREAKKASQATCEQAVITSLGTASGFAARLPAMVPRMRDYDGESTVKRYFENGF